MHCAKDHPRRCGENLLRPAKLSAALGSPPQVRGKPKRLMVDSFGDRITPAGAGKTLITVAFGLGLTDHPRRCGENFAEILPLEGGTGSPPQVRGKPKEEIKEIAAKRITPAGAGKTLRESVLLRDTRITPAGAGKTGSPGHFSPFEKDHPRRCGENQSYAERTFCKSGSPPQVRGKPELADSARAAVGITPAGAGKTFITTCSGRMTKDHPRRCGENRGV